MFLTRAFALITVTLIGLGISAPPSPAAESDRLVVVELFTSQGCNRCPPADEMMGELAKWPEVLPLSLHVDYWDFIGWTDTFALKANSERQVGYAARTTRRRLFTPLMVVGGMHMVEGYVPMQLVDHIKAHASIDPGVRMTLTKSDTGFSLLAEAAAELPEGAVVTLVTFSPQEHVAIERGENAGRAAHYTNVVTGWSHLGLWDGKTPLELELSPPKDLDPEAQAAVLIQASGQRLILGAVRLR